MPWYLRYQFPPDFKSRWTPSDPEADARTLATIWTGIPATERTVARLEAESAMAGLRGRADLEEGPELPGVERLASWLTLVKAPKRVFLEIDLKTMNRD
ncbi:hypothetical protein BH24GEM2_BH24GEM2_09580 [soil metagenome]